MIAIWSRFKATSFRHKASRYIEVGAGADMSANEDERTAEWARILVWWHQDGISSSRGSSATNQTSFTGKDIKMMSGQVLHLCTRSIYHFQGCKVMMMKYYTIILQMKVVIEINDLIALAQQCRNSLHTWEWFTCQLGEEWRSISISTKRYPPRLYFEFIFGTSVGRQNAIIMNVHTIYCIPLYWLLSGRTIRITVDSRFRCRKTSNWGDQLGRQVRMPPCLNSRGEQHV